MTLSASEIALRLGVNERHVRNLIVEGELPAINSKCKGSRRGAYRITTEGYREFILLRMTGKRRIELLRDLPKATLCDLAQEISNIIHEN